MEESLKVKLTKIVLSQLSGDNIPTVDEALKYWWGTFTYSKSLRLSTEGMNVLESLQFDSVTFDIKDSYFTTGAGVKALGTKINCPYYLTKTNIVIYDNRIALLIALHGGVRQYCDTTHT